MARRHWGPLHLYRDERAILAAVFGFGSIEEFDDFRQEQEVKEVKRLTNKARQ